MTPRRLARRVLRGVLWGLVWFVTSVTAWLLLLPVSTAMVSVAGHDAEVRPNLSGWTVVHTGPYLPDVRMESGHQLGADIVLGKTMAGSGPEIVARYAVLAARPEAEIARVTETVAGLATTAAIRAGAIGLIPITVWLLLGQRRRRELLHTPRRRVIVAGMAVTGIAVATVAPWRPDTDRVAPREWTPLAQAVPSLAVPADLAGLQVQGGDLTATTTRLVESAFDTYANSRVFYDEVRNEVLEADGFRTPEDDETVGVLLSDRHDNIGMDRVAAAIGQRAGATVVLNAGDDTSTGATWEGFSIDSVAEAFSSYDAKVSVAGNHDSGEFVSRRFREHGWTTLDGRPATIFDGVRIAGLSDPRSSGLGNWRDETGLSFGEVRDRFSEELCRLDEEDQRVATVLVHDANQARPAVERGCVDLVVAGHVHSPSGPTLMEGERGVGYTYTNGTTGGAAYAFAMGSKLRREAMVTLITWSDGRPIGVQPVTVRTTGAVDVGGYVPLIYSR